MKIDKPTSDIKIVLISSGQPTLNPRLVKEADALADAGYKVEVLYQYWNEWGTHLDKTLLADKKWSYKRIGGSPSIQKLQYLYTRIIHKIAKKLVTYFGLKGNLPELAIGRSTYLLTRAAKRAKASLYIAHNLAALPAAVNAALYTNAKSGFDAEDFHRYEISDLNTSFEVCLSTFIEDKYIPKLDYLTTASPLISDAYQDLYPMLKPQTILNVFPKQNIQINTEVGTQLKLCWFSQSIGFERGLEDVIETMGVLKNSAIELHLLGSSTSATRLAFEKFAEEKGADKSALFFYQPIEASAIFNFVAQFDIGLATEIGTPKNRDLCLTNKIFTYIHSGLAIVASDTSAQQQLMTKFNEMGMVYERNNINTLKDLLNTYLADKGLLIKHKIRAKTYANEELNWENEKYKFLKVINDLLNSKAAEIER